VSFYGYEAKDEAAKNVSEESATAPARLFRYGERLRFPAKLYPPRNFRNPGAFDYAGYLAEKESCHSGQPRQGRLNCSRASPATALNSGERASVESWSKESAYYGSQTKPLCLTPCSSARIRFSEAKRTPTFSVPARTTCW
jgi:hypothetical protein